MKPVTRWAQTYGHSGLLAMLSQAYGQQIQVAEAVLLTWPDDLEKPAVRTVKDRDGARVDVAFLGRLGHPYTFIKYAVMLPAFGNGARLPEAEVQARADAARGYPALLAEHSRAWHRLWETDLRIDGDRALQTVNHSMLFYLLSSAREDSTFSIPPMGLSSSGYYGHVFWDADTFMFPALLLLHPEIAKTLVMFRCRTLAAAHSNAVRNGYQSGGLWFAKIQRDVIARGVFTSVADLGKKLWKYIRAYAKSAKSFRRTYTDPKLVLSTDVFEQLHLGSSVQRVSSLRASPESEYPFVDGSAKTKCRTGPVQNTEIS